jgi:hypothetical protein
MVGLETPGLWGGRESACYKTFHNPMEIPMWQDKIHFLHLRCQTNCLENWGCDVFSRLVPCHVSNPIVKQLGIVQA